MAKKESKPSSIDDLLANLKNEHSKDLDASFKAHDAFNKEENQNHLYNNIFMPAQKGLYDGIVGELDKIFKDDSASVHNKEKEIKQAVTAGLTKYFDKTQPSITKAIKDLGMDADEAYDHLTGAYDTHVGADGKKIASIRLLATAAKNKKGKVHQVKRLIPGITDKHIDSALEQLGNQHLTHHFSKYHGAEIAAYMKPKLEKEGFEIKDKVGFARGDLGDMLELRKSILEKKDHKYLKKAEKKD
ncbi:MAG: hypothetical protein KKH52_01060 [Nanoarchaeota archaeon]|nr:hypothetical protein [Nanoarchaeota archaeon]MBU1622846.1 hypothetical protein [Nanoarchaeota archaeon]MBU1973966.1 hypothetical protein [Nanoarchaeota archaeon]